MVNQVFANMNTKFKAKGQFKLKAIKGIRGDDYYNQSQYVLLPKYAHLGKYREVNALISGPVTQHSAGLAYLANYLPNYFVMRTWYNGSDFNAPYAVETAADIFLHELSHTLGYPHDGPGVTTRNFIEQLTKGASTNVGNFVNKMNKEYPY